MHYAIKSRLNDQTVCIAPDSLIVIAEVHAQSQIQGASKKMECFVVGPNLFPTGDYYAEQLLMLPPQYLKPLNLTGLN